MKKALVILLVLAVAGGAFAQGWTFGGYLDGGVGLWKPDGDDSQARFGVIAHQANVGGPRMMFDANYANDDKTAGMNIRFRSQGNPSAWAAASGGQLHMRYAYGWVTALEGLLRAEGGRIQATPFDSLDPISGENIFDAYGVLGYVKPHEFVTVGGGAGSMFGMNQTVSSAQGVTPAPANQNFLERGIGYFGFNVLVPDTMRLNAALRMSNWRVGAYREENTLTRVVSRFGQEAHMQSRAALGFSFLGVKDVSLVLQGILRGLDQFSDFGQIHFYEYFAFRGIENLSINLALTQAVAQYDKNSKGDSADLYFRGWFWLTYALNDGGILPRLDFNYVMAGKYAAGYGFGFTSSYTDDGSFSSSCYTFDKDHSFMTVSPSIAFRVNPNCFFELGYFLGVDMSSGDDGSAAKVKKVAIGGKQGGISHGAFTGVKVSF